MDELAKNIYECSHLKGQFKLRSGQISQEYFDKYQFECRPHLLKQIAQRMKDLIPPESELLGGLEMGGIPIAIALSFEIGLPTVLIRKKAKNYGTAKLVEGPDITHKKVCLIEDVVTTGGQVAESTKFLRQQGALIDTVLCVIYRGSDLENEPKIKNSQLQIKPLFTKAQFNQWFS